jgi:hypothetical protein
MTRRNAYTAFTVEDYNNINTFNLDLVRNEQIIIDRIF